MTKCNFAPDLANNWLLCIPLVVYAETPGHYFYYLYSTRSLISIIYLCVHLYCLLIMINAAYNDLRETI